MEWKSKIIVNMIYENERQNKILKKKHLSNRRSLKKIIFRPESILIKLSNILDTGKYLDFTKYQTLHGRSKSDHYHVSDQNS